MTTRKIGNENDVIDSRDVIARIASLEDERADLTAAIDESESAEDAALNQAPDADTDSAAELEQRRAELADWDDDNAEELAALRALAEQAETCADDWSHGATLVRDSYFVEYCQELVSDIGDMPRDIPSYLVIDWEKTADNLRADYTSVEYGDVTYWVR